MTWNRDVIIESVVLSMNCIYRTLERVMIFDCFRINCIIERLYSSCYWFSDIFSLYDLFETWSLIHDYKTFIASAWLFSNQLFYQKNNDCKTLNVWTRHDIWCKTVRINRIVRSYRQKDEICRVIDFQIRFRYMTSSEFIARFVRDLIIFVFSSMSMFCSWCMSSKCLF